MSSDFIVIGGGLVGAAVSYGLRRIGFGYHAGRGRYCFPRFEGNFGLVWVQSKGDGMHEYAAWSKNHLTLA